MQTSRNKKFISFSAKITLAILFCLFAFVPIRQAEAALWPGIDPLIKQSLERIDRAIDGIILGTAKQAAVRALNQELNYLVTGHSVGGARFITDWRDYLVYQPQMQTNRYMNDYLSQITRGRGSLSGYLPNVSAGVTVRLGQNFEGVGPDSFNLGMMESNPSYGRLIESAKAAGVDLSVRVNAGNYVNQLLEGAKRATISPVTPQVTYVGDPGLMFANGNFRNMSLYLSGINNPWAFNLNAQQQYQERLAQEQDAARTQGQAYAGFKGTTSNGQITAPGSLIKDNVSNVQDLGNKILASAQHLPEIMTAVVSQMIARSIQQGIGNMQSMVHKEISSVRNNAIDQVNSAAQQVGPAALYRNIRN